MIHGRVEELGRVDALLGRARSGAGGALLVIGEPGIGKTTLLDAARGRAEAAGLTVIDTSGVESEATLPFAALGELVAPLERRLDELPGHQGEAVRAAVGLAPSPGPSGDSLAVFAGFLGLLERAAAARPLLLSLDDVQWLDPSSAAALRYAARRLDGIAVALIAAARSESDEAAGWDVPTLELGGLADLEARELLAETAAGLDRRAADAVVDAAAGNPLALRELPALLSDAERAGFEPVEALPPPEGVLADALGRRVDALGEEARRALLVIAAAPGERPAVTVAACSDLGLGPEALEEAEADGLIEVGEDQISFAHPLLRGAVYESAAPSDRRQVHRALAARSESDAAAWHLAAAALGADDEAAAALEGAGHTASARGAYASAADALARSAELTADATARSGRLLAAGISAALGGGYARGVELLEAAGESDDRAIRAGARHMLAMACLTGGVRGAHENHALLRAEAERTLAHDRDAAAAMLADCSVIAVVAGDCRLALDSAHRAHDALSADAPGAVRCQVLASLGMGLSLDAQSEAARDALDEAGGLLDAVDPLSPAAQSVSFALGARLSTGQERKLLGEVRELARLASERGSLGLLPYFQLQAADAAFRLGEWDTALNDAEAAVAGAEASGQAGPLSIALVVLARMLGLRSRVAEARIAAERGIQLATPVGYGSTLIWARAALGQLALAAGDAENAIAELEPLAVLAPAAGLEDPVIVPWAPDLVEALARVGRAEEAREQAAALTARSERSGTALARALAARSQALAAADGATAIECFEAALDQHSATDLPFERARTLFGFGAALHREGVRRAARERLREALEVFETLGAEMWTAQARAELAAAGAVERPRTAPAEELTARELEVARAVARGATNREVAAELFLSPKTIEFHLGRVYGKLGVRSRTELAAAAAQGRLPEAELELR